MPETTELEANVVQPPRRANRSGTEAAFRATVEARLRSLEGQLDEVKARLNGLLFFIAGTVIADVVLRVAE
jgi:hypothetical protein